MGLMGDLLNRLSFVFELSGGAFVGSNVFPTSMGRGSKIELVSVGVGDYIYALQKVINVSRRKIEMRDL